MRKGQRSFQRGEETPLTSWNVRGQGRSVGRRRAFRDRGQGEARKAPETRVR